MSMIFDRFPSRTQAESFCRAVGETMQLNAEVFDSQDQSNRVDPFPWQLDAPIVLVDRSTADEEVRNMAHGFGGHFAGT